MTLTTKVSDNGGGATVSFDVTNARMANEKAARHSHSCSEVETDLREDR